MSIYAYIRVSTDKQDLDNQRHGVIDYAQKKQTRAFILYR